MRSRTRLHDLSRHSGAALVAGYTALQYSQLPQLIEETISWLTANGVLSGSVVGIEMTPSIESVIGLLACWECGVSTVLLSADESDRPMLAASRPRTTLCCYPKLHLNYHDTDGAAFEIRLLHSLRSAHLPGFVIFSSGTTVQPKPVLHDVDRFIRHYRPAYKATRSLSISGFHTMSGFDALLYSLLSGSTLVIPPSAKIDDIADTVAHQSVETLALTPSAVRLLALSAMSTRYDFTAVTTLVLGAEPIDSQCLTLVRRLFPKARIVQKYGASEFGVLQTRSHREDPRWLKVEDVADSTAKKLRVLDGELWLRRPSSLLNYLDDTPLQIDDSWLCTGDRVEVQDGWINVVGRASSMINTGGSMVNPLEVEAKIQLLKDIKEVSVYAEPNPLLGEMVCADVVLDTGIKNSKALIKRIHDDCKTRLSKVQRPVCIRIVDSIEISSAFKKTRRPKPSSAQQLI